MMTLTYELGQWHAEARVQELAAGKLLAVISVSDDSGTGRRGSRHTIVFDQAQGSDGQQQTDTLVRGLLHSRYSLLN